MNSEKDVQKQIRQAVNELPSLLTPKTPPPKKPKTPHDFVNEHYHQAKRAKIQLIWAGVAVIVLLIMTLWTYNVTSLAGDAFDGNSIESQLIAENAAEIKDIFQNENSVANKNEFTELLKQTDSTEGIKDSLQNLVIAISNAQKEALTAPSTTTSTTVTSTIDTTINTSTISATTTL